MLSEKPWPPEQVLQLLIRLFASMLIGMALVTWLNSVHGLDPNMVKMLTLALGTLSFHGVALVLIHHLLRDQGIGWGEAFGFHAPRPGHALLLALAVAMAVLPIAWSLGQVSERVMSIFH